MRAFRWLLVTCLVGLAASMALAERGVVKTNNGQSFEGDISEQDDFVTVFRQGIQTKIARSDVRTIVYTGDPIEAIKKDWAKLAKDDAAGRVRLSRKAFEIRDYATARDLANEALVIDPNNRDAVDMDDLIRRQVALESKTNATTRAAKGPRTVGGALDQSLAIPLLLVDEQDINGIKQAELRPDDVNLVRVRFLNDVRRRFSIQPQNNPAAFSQLSAFQQAMTIISEGDADMRRDVQIVGDPGAIKGFRAIQKFVLNDCAATSCHGSLAGGNFILFNMPDTDPVTYTNFLLLQRYSKINTDKPNAIFGGAGARLQMINREHPRKSLLLENGLPVDAADTPHPRVPGFRGVFRDIDDPIYVRIANWIANDLKPTVPAYSLVKYVSPVQAMSGVESPATAATSKPAPKGSAPATTPPAPTPAPVQPDQPAPRPIIPMPPVR